MVGEGQLKRGDVMGGCEEAGGCGQECGCDAVLHHGGKAEDCELRSVQTRYEKKVKLFYCVDADSLCLFLLEARKGRIIETRSTESDTNFVKLFSRIR